MESTPVAEPETVRPKQFCPKIEAANGRPIRLCILPIDHEGDCR